MATSKQPSPVFKEPMPYTREVILFRLGGVALYQSTVNAIAMISLGVISSRSESPRSFLTIVACSLFLLVLHILPSTVLSLAQVTIEPQPLFLEKHLPRSWRVPPGKLLPLGRLLGRAASLAHLWRLLALLAAYSLTGGVSLEVYLWSRGYSHTSGQAVRGLLKQSWNAGVTRFGALLGAVFALSLVVRGKDTLDFPVIQRHRIFRIKKQKYAVASDSAVIPLVTLAVQLVLSLLGWASWRGVWSGHPFALLTASCLCTFCFSMGRRIVQVISSEQLTFLPPAADPGATSNVQLYKALQDNEGETFQTLALLQLCSIAETSGRASERRRAIFADETGASWQLPAQVCLQEVGRVVSVASECLPQSMPKPALSSTSSLQAPQWNQRPLKAKQGLAVPDRQQDVAAWLIRARYQRVQWAVRALAGFAVASCMEDSCGVLQSTEPGLGAVLQSLLSLVLVLRQHNKTTASTGNRRREEVTDSSTDGAARYAHALCDVAMTAVRRLADEFGEDLRRPLLEAATKPGFGSPAELLALLESCFKGQARH